MPIIFAGTPNPPPYAPTLLSPPNATYEVLTGTPTFTWQYNPSQVGRTQTGYGFARKIAGASSYEWWNAGTSAWQGTFVLNTSTAQTLTFPSAAWADGNAYNWHVVTADANGTGTGATDFTVNAQDGPVVTVLSPGGTITEAQPLITWAAVLPEGANQTSFRAVIYNPAQYGAMGFTPGSGPSVFDTGVVAAAFVSQATPTVLLANSVVFKAYVQITETGGQASEWAVSSFTTSYEAPALPLLVVTQGIDSDTGAPITTLTVTGQDGGSTADLVGLTVAQLTYSDDGGITFWPVRDGSNVPLPADTQQAVVIDYEAPLSFDRIYQAQITAVL